MHIESFRAYCLTKKGVTECFPFDENVLVFKVLDKMFALTNVSNPNFKVSLKCDPDRAIILRERFFQVTPAFHMHKKHWNSIDVNTNFPRDLLTELIDHSYDLVVAKMTKKNREFLNNP